jgi:hypothetical protein
MLLNPPIRKSSRFMFWRWATSWLSHVRIVPALGKAQMKSNGYLHFCAGYSLNIQLLQSNE